MTFKIKFSAKLRIDTSHSEVLCELFREYFEQTSCYSANKCECEMIWKYECSLKLELVFMYYTYCNEPTANLFLSLQTGVH